MANGIIGALGSPLIGGIRQGVSENVQTFLAETQRLKAEQQAAAGRRQQAEATQKKQDLDRLKFLQSAAKTAVVDLKLSPDSARPTVQAYLDALKEDFPNLNVSADDTEKVTALLGVTGSVIDPKKTDVTEEVGANLIESIGGIQPEPPQLQAVDTSLRFQEEVAREREEEAIGKAGLTEEQAAKFRLTGKLPSEAGVDGRQVQSSKIFDDGTVELVYTNGDTEVKSPEEAAKEMIKSSQVFGAKIQGLRQGERGAASEAIKQSAAAFKKLVPIKKNIKNLNEGIRLIDEGAQTGVIAKRFPSIKTASLELENLQGRLGLDVIADVTFGALSESELAFAKDTALPIGLEGEPLKAWLTRKRDAQIILAETLEEAALFLGEPGNSVPDYIRFKRGQAQTQVTQQLPQGITEEDIIETMRANNMTRQQVMERLQGGR
jgi:hypothetical protein